MIETARITITRVLDDEGEDVVSVEAVTPDGDGLPLIESLGMLALAHDTVLRDAMEDDD